jgi:hypothetical protein
MDDHYTIGVDVFKKAIIIELLEKTFYIVVVAG